MKNDKTAYWLYLESYSFIFKGTNYHAIYNSMSGAYIKVPQHVLINPCLDRLNKKGSGYCIRINGDLLQNAEFNAFVSQLRNTFSGDLLPVDSVPHKPFIFKPRLKIIGDAEIKEDGKTIAGRNVLKNLDEVSIYVNSLCDKNCAYCSRNYKQVLHCTCMKSKKELSLEQGTSILSQLEGIGVKQVNLLGGDLSRYAPLKDLLDILATYTCHTTVYVHISQWESMKHYVLDKTPITFRVIVPAEAISSLSCWERNPSVEYEFLISSEEDAARLDSVPEDIIESAEVKSIYTGDNEPFFENYVYTTWEDLLNAHLSKKDIFRKQVLNELFYGRLTILANGDTYANLNFPKLGNIFRSSLKELVYKEMKGKGAWFYTRNRGVCKTCANRYLCTSPSNYELVLNRLDLCHCK